MTQKQNVKALKKKQKIKPSLTYHPSQTGLYNASSVHAYLPFLFFRTTSFLSDIVATQTRSGVDPE